MAARLTDIAIRNLKPAAVRQEIPDGQQRGLYVVVHATGAKGFAVRYRFGGRSRRLVLQGGLTLAQARKAAADAMFNLQQGVDPAEEKAKAKTEQRTADSLATVCEAFFKREGGKIRSTKQWQRDLDRLVFPTLGKRPIASIKRREIVRLLDHVEDNSGPGAAETVLAIIRRVMNWHAVRDDDFRSPIVRGMTRRKTSEHARSRVLNDDELRAVWRAADGTPGPFGRYVQFLLLTACRRNEAAHLKWSEIHGATWEMPASRNKVKADLTRPLSAAALAALDKVPRIAGSDFVFSAHGRPLGGMTRRKKQIDQASGVRDWTLHDLRRTARTLMSRAGVPREHAERCLGHVIGGVEGVYDQHGYREEMLVAYEKLATLIGQIVDPQPNVVTLQSRSGT
jgi:integrase